MRSTDSKADTGTSTRHASLAIELRGHWESGRRPRIEDILAARTATTTDELAAAVRVDLRERWRRGERPEVDEYFTRFPVLASEAEIALDLIYTEYLVREDHHTEPPFAEYERRFPQYAQVLARQIGLHRAIEADLDLQANGAGDSENLALDPTEGRPTREQPGSYIGRYKLLQQIGEGGMGVVYLAEQTEPVERRVAIKIIKPGMDSQLVIARFEAERQALALMDHPNIARVLDAGTTTAGQPYFVMEVVKGVPITQYCDERRLTPRRRLELFTSVCQAVQHAHQKGIIHRDLKPSNVLVAEYDEEPVVKIIDFGVAKAIGQRLTERTMFTQIGQFVGTIDYMSPEQAKLNQLDVDTRTDIYSLGVLLYELLTGETPFERKRLHDAAFDEMLRIVREEEPPRPSVRLSSSGALISIAAQRCTEPKRLSSIVRGELDWIVMKALDKERARRYETANALAMDIQRFLSDEPVLACPPTAAYRLRKFARRNTATLVAGGIVTAALVAGTVVSTWQAIRATQAERAAETARAAEAAQTRAAVKERNQADANLQQARAVVNEFYTTVSESKLIDLPGLQPLRRDLLEGALRYYQGFALERSNDPRVMADVAVTHLRIAQINSGLNRNDDAIAAIRLALEIIERLRREHPEDRESRARLAGFSTERRWVQADTTPPRNPLVAFQTLLQLESLWQDLAAENAETPAFGVDLAAIDASIAALLHWTGRYQDATRYFQKAVDVGEALVAKSPDKPQYRSALADVSLMLSINKSALGAPEEAAMLMRRAVELNEGLVADFPDVPVYRLNLTSALVALAGQVVNDQPEEAAGHYRRVGELAGWLLDKFPGHLLYVEKLTTAVSQAAIFEDTRGNDAIAEAALGRLERALSAQVAARTNDRMARERLGFACLYVATRIPDVPSHDAISIVMYRLGLTVFAELTAEFPEVPVYAEHAGHCHQSLATMALHGGQLVEALNQQESAVANFAKAAAHRPKTEFGARHLAGAYRALSFILDRQNRLTEALAAAQTAVQTDGNEWIHRVRLIEVLRALDADQRPAKALAVLKPFADVAPADTNGWLLRANTRAVLGRTDEAVDDFVRAVESGEDAPWWFTPRKLACREISLSPELFDRVAALRPDETTLWIGRAQQQVLFSNWHEAVKDYARVVRLRPLADDGFEFAALLVLTGDRVGYQAYCEELIGKFADPQGADAFQLARICEIGPAEGVDAAQLVDWANRGLGDRNPWNLLALALAEYRAGQFEAALSHHRESLGLAAGKDWQARNLLGLAACSYRLGKTADAHRHFAQARQRLDLDQSALQGKPVLFYSPCDWIAVHVTLREVELLLATPLTAANHSARNDERLLAPGPFVPGRPRRSYTASLRPTHSP